MEKISNPTPPPWMDLPTHMMANILQRLGPVDILESAEKVCAMWWRVCKDPSMWRVIDMIDPADMNPNIQFYLGSCPVDRSNLGDKNDLRKKSATLCCRAVDRSQGGLIDIRIGPFCTANLLSYISDRSSHLKSLTISADISSRGLTAAVKKWGELEELRIFHTPFNTAQDIETIGICCPLLNTFAFNNSLYVYLCREKNDDRALAIAKNMPNLRHLELNGNALTEKGLQAILDGCRRLESLDLRGSGIYGLEEGDFRKRCSWIKDLRLPPKYFWKKDPNVY